MRKVIVSLVVMAALFAAMSGGGASSLAAPPVTPAESTTPPPSTGVTVLITDSGYVPPNLTIPPGTQVNWVNRGTKVHTATSDTPVWNTGGMGPNQWNFYVFTGVGVYPYHSEPDASYLVNSDGSTTRTWNLAGTITVDASASVPTTVPGAAPPSPAAPTPTVSPALLNAAVTIVEGSYQPLTITIAMGGYVTFSNTGNNVHTATSDTDNPFWDTGGLSNSQNATVQFNVPGSYPYHSATDANPPGSKNFSMRGQVVVQPPVGPTPIPVITPAVLITRTP